MYRHSNRSPQLFQTHNIVVSRILRRFKLALSYERQFISSNLREPLPTHAVRKNQVFALVSAPRFEDRPENRSGDHCPICISEFETAALLSLERAYMPEKSRRKKNCRESVTTTCISHGLIVHRISLKPNNAAVVKNNGCRQPQSPTAVNELRVIPLCIVFYSGKPRRSLPAAVLIANRRKP